MLQTVSTEKRKVLKTSQRDRSELGVDKAFPEVHYETKLHCIDKKLLVWALLAANFKRPKFVGGLGRVSEKAIIIWFYHFNCQLTPKEPDRCFTLRFLRS